MGRYVTTEQAADLAKVTVSTIRSWVYRRKLKPVGNVGGKAYYDASDVLRIEAATRRRPRIRRLASAAAQGLQL